MHHYTYLIMHKASKKKYIGVRSCKCLPKDDISYWGSSKYLPDSPEISCKKRVLRTFSSRKDAIAHEIWLHDKYDVAVNPNFFNKAKQTTLSFDTSGTKLTQEHKEKCSKALKERKFTDIHKQKISTALLGRTKSPKHKANMSKAQKKLVQTPDYKNPMQGIKMSKITKKKISEAKKKKKNVVVLLRGRVITSLFLGLLHAIV